MKDVPTKSITLRASEGRVTRIKCNEDGDLIFTSGTDGQLCVWNVQTGKRLGTYLYSEKHPFDAEKSLQEAQMDFHATKNITDFDVNRRCTEIVATRVDEAIIWDVLTGQVIDVIKVNGFAMSVEFCQSINASNRLVIGVSDKFGTIEEPEICIYECPDLQPDCYGKQNRGWSLVKVFRNLGSDPTFVRWGPLDESIICGTHEGYIIVWSMGGRELHRIKAHDEEIKAFSFNKDRSVMLTVSRDRYAKLWNTTTMKIIAEYKLGRPLNACALNPLCDLDGDEQYFHAVVAGGQDASEVTTTKSNEGQFEIIIYDLMYGKEVGRVSAHYSPSMCLTYLKDGTGFATGTFEGNSKIILLPKTFYQQCK